MHEPPVPFLVELLRFWTSLEIQHFHLQDEHLHVQRRLLHSCQLQTYKQMIQGHNGVKKNKWSVNMDMIMDKIMDAPMQNSCSRYTLTLIGILCPWAVCDMELKSVVQRRKHACLLAHTQEHTCLMFSDSLSLIRNNCCMFVQLWNWTKSHSI